MRLPFPVLASFGHGEALPNGRYVVTTGERVILTGNDLPPLPDGMQGIYPHLFAANRVVCQGHQKPDPAYVWDGAEWKHQGLTFGAKATIWDAHGELHIIRTPQDRGAPQGYRYVAEDGRIVTVDETLGHDNIPRGIFEYTERGGITIGQALTDELIAILPDGTYRLIEGGVWRHIVFHRDGDSLAIAGVRNDTSEAVLLWLSVHQLAALPVFKPNSGTTLPSLCRTVYFTGEAGNCSVCGQAKSIHRLREPAPKEGDMKPEDVARFTASHIDFVNKVIHDYPDLSGGEIVDQVAHRLNAFYELDPIRFGRKARQSDGGNPNEDVLALRLDLADNSKKKLIDVLIDGGDADKPTWNVRPASEEDGNGFWCPPVNADRDGEPQKPPPTDPDLPEELRKVRTELAELRGMAMAAVEAAEAAKTLVAHVELRLQKIEAIETDIDDEIGRIVERVVTAKLKHLHVQGTIPIRSVGVRGISVDLPVITRP